MNTAALRSDLDAGAFAFVMATGIVAVAAAAQGLPLLSDALLALACFAWLVLGALIASRVLVASSGSASARRRPRLHAFALVAATAVIGARFAQTGDEVPGLALWAVATGLWFLLLVQRPVVGEARGSSLLVVVGTEALAVLAALLAPRWSAAFLVVALGGWILGIALYPPTIGLAFRRRRRFDPDLWIVMGALAITTLAGSELLLAARALHTLHEVSAWLPDADLAIWASASALIVPLLLAELRTPSQWRYEANRWSFVFPLGMYAAASHTLSRADKISFLNRVSLAFFVIAVAAWAVVLIGLARRTRGARRHPL